MPPFTAPVFGKPNASTVCEKHTRVICLYLIKIRSVTKDNAIFLLICDSKNNFFYGVNLFFYVFFRLSTGMVGTDSWF